MRLVGLAVLGLGVVFAVLRVRSYIHIESGRLSTSFFSFSGALDLHAVSAVRSRPSKASLFVAPAMEFTDAHGRRATIRLGWWHSEARLLRLISEAIGDREIDADDLSRQLLRKRPSGESWDLRAE